MSRANVIWFASIAGLTLLTACDMQSERPAPRPVSFNPPGTALAALPTSNIVLYHVEVDSDSTRIGRDDRQAIADSMAGNTTTATVVGADRANMRLPRDRPFAVREAWLVTGKTAPAGIMTRWTGDRAPNSPAAVNVADADGRVIDIGVP